MATKTKTPAPPADGKTEDKAKRPTLDIALISTPYQVAAVEAERTAPRHARTDAQAAMDVIVNAVYERWVEAERPSAWLKMPKAKYPVPPEQAEAWRRLITNSAAATGHRARIGAAGSLCTGLDLDHQNTDEYNPCGECLKIEAAMVAANNDLPEDQRMTDEGLAEAIKTATGGHELVVFAILDKRPNKNRDKAEAGTEDGNKAPEAANQGTEGENQ